MEQEIKPMKPILFSTAMVRAILDGRKTVTRRLVKPQHLRVLDSPYHKEHPEMPDKLLLEKLCEPSYRRGDILYVRETWRVQSAHRFEADVRIEYAAGGPMTTIQFPGRKSQSHSRDKYDEFIGKWADDKFHPSIHMPKEAARIFLRVTDVRVERLQNITDAGAMDEGAEGVACDCDGKFFCSRCCNTGFLTAPRDEFARIWGSTAPPRYGWEANPWVWVIESERISKNEATEGGT